MIYSAIEKYDGILFPSHKDAGHHGPAEATTMSMDEHSYGGDQSDHSGHMSYDLDSMARYARSAGASSSGPGFVSNDPVQAKIMIAMTLAIICGIVQVSVVIFQYH